MNKKDYVLKVLNAIKSDWPMAEWLMVLLEDDKLDDKSLDAISSILQNAIEKTTDGLLKNKLSESQSILKDLKSAEDEEKELNKQDIIELEQKIANL